MSPSESRLRASDADRDRVASLLQEHHAAGRLTAEEFAERLDVALQARTLGELDELLADLPQPTCATMCCRTTPCTGRPPRDCSRRTGPGHKPGRTGPGINPGGLAPGINPGGLARA